MAVRLKQRYRQASTGKLLGFSSISIIKFINTYSEISAFSPIAYATV